MIRLDQVSKTFDRIPVVDGINLTIKPGEIIGLLGPNGAGKTTTIRILAGVLPPTHGMVTIDGKNFNDHEFDLKKRIGYMPENNPLYEELTVEEHLQFWARMKQIPENHRDEAITFAVDNTGISSVYYRFIGELSKGFRQRTGLAQAILTKPNILLLDEPTEGLDPNQRRDIQELLESLKRDRTVIVSSHVLAEISKIANRIIIINNGLIVGDGKPDVLMQAKKGIQVVEVELKGKGVLKKLNSLEGVEKVTKQDGNIYTVQAQTKKDIRENIFSLAVDNGWTLLSMQRVQRQLEDVFSELTEHTS